MVEKIFKRLWHRVLSGGELWPTSLTICISSYCNLQCRMCPLKKAHKTNPQYMTVNTFEKLIPAIETVPRVYLLGLGEPLLNKNLTLFIKLIKTRKADVEIELITNGTLLTEDLAQALVELELDRISVSIDGATAETVESIREGVNFKRLIGNISSLRRVREKNNSKRPLIIANYTVCYSNYVELADFVGLAKEIGVDHIQLSEVQPLGYSDFERNLVNSINMDNGRILEKAIRLGNELDVKVFLPLYPKDICVCMLVPIIKENGEVCPCYFHQYDRKFYSEGKIVEVAPVSFGNINNATFHSIWNSKEYQEFRKNNFRRFSSQECKHCINNLIRASERSRSIAIRVEGYSCSYCPDPLEKCTKIQSNGQKQP